MGIPQHYSRERPERCLRLVEALFPAAQQVTMPGQEDFGPLTTTFLLAMSTPAIVVPIERVERHRNGGAGYMNDRPIGPELAEAIDRALGGDALKNSPFFREGHWRFSTIQYEGQNLAQDFPAELAEKLNAPEARDVAANMCASAWTSCLRNALAHGGVAYLDGSGHQSHGQKTEMLAFVSAKYPDGNLRKPPKLLKALRINENDFRIFLKAWVEWLRSSGLSMALAA